MIHIKVDPSVKAGWQSLPLHRDCLKDAAKQTISYASSATTAGLTLVLGDDALSQRLNLQYLGIDSPTDVLSFSAEYIDPDSQAPYLGDIIISLPRAQAQAAAARHSVEDELTLLVVHGVLHLLGYDHAEKAEKEKMQAAQDDILKSLGYNSLVQL